MRQLAIGLICFCFSISSFTQETKGINEFSVFAGISDYGSFMNFKTTKGIYNLGLNYRFTKYFDVGIQMGYGQLLDEYGSLPGANSIAMHLYRYSVKGGFHILPLFNITQNFPLDIFLRGCIGGLSAIATEAYTGPASYSKADYGIYLGIKYNPIKRLGIYGEVGFGNFSYSQFGVSVAF